MSKTNAKKLKDKGVNVTPFVIGLGMDLSYLDKFKCIGNYEDAETKEAFERVLQNVVQKALLNTTVQINLNDIAGAPNETDVTMFLYEAGTTNLKYTFTHTLNRFGNPDTLIMDPELSYDLVVNTTPRVEKKNIVIKRNIHNTIEVDAPQGKIRLRYLNAAKPYQIDARIMQDGSQATLNVQKIGSSDKYLVGTYLIEILTLPRIYATVNVEQNTISDINIKAPGFFSYSGINTIIGQIFMKNDNGTWDWVTNLEVKSNSGKVQLQPGEYRMVYRQIELKSSTYTMQNDFRINSNSTTTLKL